ncbi:hypothetical protein N7474_006038 [Penicillium riverlandense]|uniref:uncharacterized protein n=1 Tax=Penicillium riverlandense TaxID=1903569 RepID=UPI002548B22C|nr:uncharacterized protein N7474_006038 [Penicillium riverlandense]KAJ5820447.1 hypothetical protein N7474_006038 [Penicillium riverlandense]
MASPPNKRPRQASLHHEARIIMDAMQLSPCARCKARNMTTSYAPQQTFQPQARLSVSSSASSRSSPSLPPTMTEVDPQASFRLSDEDDDSDPTQSSLPAEMEDALHLQDLELMMHWCTTTYRSVVRDRLDKPLWQTVIPRLSLRHAPLRHGLLALSALHLSTTSTSPEQKWTYVVTAREHHSEALAGIQLAELYDLTTAECNAVYALCILMTIFPFAYCQINNVEDEPAHDEGDDEQSSILDEFIEVFQLTRWLLGAMKAVMSRVAASDLAPLTSPAEACPTMPDMSRLVVQALQRQNELETARQPTQHETAVFESAIHHLSDSLETLMKGAEPKAFAFCWISQVPTAFVDLVEQRQPFALVVLAHYAVILHHLRDSWWMGEWGTRVLREIGDALGPDWRPLINWPVDATGCFLPEI